MAGMTFSSSAGSSCEAGWSGWARFRGWARRPSPSSRCRNGCSRPSTGCRRTAACTTTSGTPGSGSRPRRPSRGTTARSEAEAHSAEGLIMYPGTHAAAHPDKPAVVMDQSGESVSYAQLEDRSVRLASALRDRGLRRGDVVALLAENHVRYFEVYWAAHRCGL